MYRVGFPGWKLAARWNVPLLVKLDVLHDKEAAVFIVTSRDLRGLVVEVPESASAEQFHEEIHGCIDMLMEDLLKQPPRARPSTVWPGEFSPA